MDKRRFVLVGVQSAEAQSALRHYFDQHIDDSVTFFAIDGTDLLIKASRTKPTLVIFSYDLQKTSAVDVYMHLKQDFGKDPVAYVYIGPELPSIMEDDRALGNLVWISSIKPADLAGAIAQALNSLRETSRNFAVRHLVKGEVLMREGEESEYLYYVMKGSLRATLTKHDDQTELGKIRRGEFVGEMGVINAEKRVATVTAEDNCQLLEIPARDFNKVVLTRPSWTKTLMATLTKRLKSMNEILKRP